MSGVLLILPYKSRQNDDKMEKKQDDTRDVCADQTFTERINLVISKVNVFFGEKKLTLLLVTKLRNKHSAST